MNAPDYFENMDFSIPEASLESPCGGDANGVVASAGVTNITRAEVMLAVQNAVAGAVEAAVHGVVSEAVSAAVRANVSANATEAERRFRQKYLGLAPAGQEDVVLLRAPRLKVDESSVVTLDSASESLSQAEAAESSVQDDASEAAAQADTAEVPQAEAAESSVEADAAEVSQTDASEVMPPLDAVQEPMPAEPDGTEAIAQADAPEGTPVADDETQPPAAEADAQAAMAPAPVVPEPVVPAPVAAAPASPEPVVPEPVVPEPVAAAPVVPEPVVPAPVAAAPASPEPVIPEPVIPAKRDVPAMPDHGAKAAPSAELALRGEKSIQFVGFQVGTQMYAVPSILIQEVIRRQPLNRLPVQTRFVPGVINLRGQVIPLVSLRELLQADMPREGSRNQFSIIMGTSGMHIALEVDRIRSMYVVQQSEIVWNVSGLLGLDDDTIIGLFELEERLVPILSVERVGAILLEEGLDFNALNT